MTSRPAIEVCGVGRTFPLSGNRTLTALQDVNFQVAVGEIVGLLGANGAGKTTLTKILATLLLPSTGNARILGHDVVTGTREVRRVSSVVLGGDRGLYNRITGRENLSFFGMLAGVSRADLRVRVPEMFEQVHLADAADRRVETYSKGMRQRLHVAIGLISRPEVMLLDEPTVGLDPIEADRLREAIAALRAQGVSVLLTSHQLLDMERLADRVLMLADGEITADLPLSAFAALAGYAAVVTIRYQGRLPGAATALPPGAEIVEQSDGGNGVGAHLVLKLREWNGDSFRVLGALVDGVRLEDIEVRPARLEEAFAALARKPK